MSSMLLSFLQMYIVLHGATFTKSHAPEFFLFKELHWVFLLHWFGVLNDVNNLQNQKNAWLEEIHVATVFVLPWSTPSALINLALWSAHYNKHKGAPWSSSKMWKLKNSMSLRKLDPMEYFMSMHFFCYWVHMYAKYMTHAVLQIKV